MENINYKTWTLFYQEFANQLLKYKDNRKDLITLVKQVYENTIFKLPTLEKEHNITDIDPFTVFALFNRQISKENRITIINEFAKLINIKLKVPTEFDGIPLANNQSTAFYFFEDQRGVNDIQILWDVFENAIDYSDNASEENKKNLEIVFDTALTQKGVKWKLTMGLFWIRPYSFVNLDTLNRNYLIEIKDIFNSYPKLKVDKFLKFDTYISLCNDVKKLFVSNEYEFSNFPEMSHYAYIKDDSDDINYWWLNCNPKIWSFSNIKVGETQSYELYNENGNKRKIYQNFVDAKKGDILVVYETTPSQKIVGFAKIIKEQDGERIYFEKTKELENPIEFEPLRNKIELENMEYLKNAQGSLFKLTKKEYNFIISLEEQTPKISKAHVMKWFAPFINALKDLGGSSTPKDVMKKIAENEKLSDEVLNEVRGKTNQNKFDNEVRWVRDYFGKSGIINKDKKGVWELTELGNQVVMTDEIATLIIRNKWNSNKELLQAINIKQKQYWIYSPGKGASKWEEFYSDGIMAIAWDYLGDFERFSTKEDVKLELQTINDENKSFMNDALAIWQFRDEMKIGDIVYAKKGVDLILGRGIVKSDYIYDEKSENFKNFRKIEWTHKVELNSPENLAPKTLTNLTQYTDFVRKLEELFVSDDEEVVLDDASYYSPYDKDNFLSEVYMNDEDYDTLTLLLSVKKNVILQGAPGVGKTFIAKRLAYSIMEECDTSRVSMIQFHQSYSYEDFIMGYKPKDDGFERTEGVFYKFCKKAQDDDERDYFFIIDEINRGNLSKIFGELFMLIENDKRDVENSMRLLYVDEQFFIPSNVHIIGMMNTADRSLSMVDFALRRRFAFYDINPAFENESFLEYQKKLNNPKFDKLVTVVKTLNSEITEDISLGSGFRIGHSYFSSGIDDVRLKMIVNFEIIPLLKEYWFDEIEKVEEWTKKLQGAII